MDENAVRDLPVIVNREKSGSKPGQLIEPFSGGTAVCVQPRARSVARTETRLASAMSAGVSRSCSRRGSLAVATAANAPASASTRTTTSGRRPVFISY